MATLKLFQLSVRVSIAGFMLLGRVFVDQLNRDVRITETYAVFEFSDVFPGALSGLKSLCRCMVHQLPSSYESTKVSG